MSADSWDTTELGKLGGETYSADYHPDRNVVRITTPDGHEEFPVDAGGWEQQATRELAARGYGARWNRWEDGPDGTRVMSTARTRYPDAEVRRAPAPTPVPEPPAAWVPGPDAASWTPHQAEPVATGEASAYGRVRVYPSYTFPVHQSKPGGIGLDQQITVTDYNKQGRAWAEGEARRQVGDALGDAKDADWWMGRAKKDSVRWLPYKGTPRDALPVNPAEQPAWQPERPETETAPAPAAPGTGTETGEIGAAERRRRVDAAAAEGTPFVLAADDVKAGDRVLDTGNGELGTVTAVDERGGVTVDYGRELTPGHPGSSGVHMLSTALEAGALQKVPAGSTPALLEDRRPPAEQATRYAERQDHHREHRGEGKRAKKGYRAHARGCSTCSDIDQGGDGVGRKLAVVAPAPTPVEPAEEYPIRFTFTGGAGAGDDEGEVRHWAFEAALDALRDHVGGWVIPDDRSGVLDTDAFIASIGGYVNGVGAVLASIAAKVGGGQTPIAPVVAELMDEFASALEAMASEAAEVYQQWRENDDNAHDLRRAEGEIPGAHLFNVA
jgi:hypothetical protein